MIKTKKVEQKTNNDAFLQKFRTQKYTITHQVNITEKKSTENELNNVPIQ